MNYSLLSSVSFELPFAIYLLFFSCWLLLKMAEFTSQRWKKTLGRARADWMREAEYWKVEDSSHEDIQEQEPVSLESYTHVPSAGVDDSLPLTACDDNSLYPS